MSLVAVLQHRCDPCRAVLCSESGVLPPLSLPAPHVWVCLPLHSLFVATSSPSATCSCLHRSAVIESKALPKGAAPARTC